MDYQSMNNLNNSYNNINQSYNNIQNQTLSHLANRIDTSQIQNDMLSNTQNNISLRDIISSQKNFNRSAFSPSRQQQNIMQQQNMFQQQNNLPIQQQQYQQQLPFQHNQNQKLQIQQMLKYTNKNQQSPKKYNNYFRNQSPSQKQINMLNEQFQQQINQPQQFYRSNSKQKQKSPSKNAQNPNLNLNLNQTYFVDQSKDLMNSTNQTCQNIIDQIKNRQSSPTVQQQIYEKKYQYNSSRNRSPKQLNIELYEAIKRKYSLNNVLNSNVKFSQNSARQQQQQQEYLNNSNYQQQQELNESYQLNYNNNYNNPQNVNSQKQLNLNNISVDPSNNYYSQQNSARKYFEDLKGTSEQLLKTLQKKLNKASQSPSSKNQQAKRKIMKDQDQSTSNEDAGILVQTPQNRSINTNEKLLNKKNQQQNTFENESYYSEANNSSSTSDQHQQNLEMQRQEKLLFLENSAPVIEKLLSSEQYLYDIQQSLNNYLNNNQNQQYNSNQMDILLYSKNYILNINEIQGLEKTVSGKQSRKAVQKMLILERIMILLCFQSTITDLQQQNSENNIDINNINIYNGITYVQQSCILLIDYIQQQLEQYQQTEMLDQMQNRIQQRKQNKKFPTLQNKAERLQIISNFNDIIQPTLKLIINQLDTPLVNIKEIINNIDQYINVEKTSNQLFDIFNIYKQFEIADNLLAEKQNEFQQQVIMQAQIQEQEQRSIQQQKIQQQKQLEQEQIQQEQKLQIQQEQLKLQQQKQEQEKRELQLQQQQEEIKKQHQKLFEQEQKQQQFLMQQQQEFENQQKQLQQQQQQQQYQQKKSPSQQLKSIEEEDYYSKQQEKEEEQEQRIKKQQQDEKNEKVKENHEKQQEKQQLTEEEQLKQKQAEKEGVVGSAIPPYLPVITPEQQEKTYTLVLDLDETLVHYEELEDGGQFLVRPYAESFLEEMGQYYEIVIFTAALRDYADFILDIIDQKGQIKHKFYRQHTVPNGNSYVKDLSRIGRDLNKVLIIDNLAENFSLQPDNGISILSWFGEPDDRALFDLTPLLKQIVQKSFKDVRQALKQFRNKMIQRISDGVENPHQNLDLNPDEIIQD